MSYTQKSHIGAVMAQNLECEKCMNKDSYLIFYLTIALEAHIKIGGLSHDYCKII
jgi:hypothetical protein